MSAPRSRFEIENCKCDAKCTHMTLSAECSTSTVSRRRSRFTGKERDTNSGKDYSSQTLRLKLEVTQVV